MSIEDLATQLSEHERFSEKRFRSLNESIQSLKGHTMSDSPQIKNIFEPANPMAYGNMGYGAGAAGLGGAGGAALGALFGSALGGNGGLFGNRNGVVDGVTPMQLASSTASIIDSNQNTTLLQAVGDTKLAVATTGAGIQIAADANTQAIRTHLGQVENTIGTMASNNLQAINGVNVNVLQSAAATREAVNTMGQANLMATKDSQYATQVAISNSTKEILAAFNEQNTANLQRQLTVAENALADQRAEFRSRGTEVNVSQTVNQNQLQLQAQAQQQQQAILLGNIWERLNGMQQAIATNSNMIIGNTGAVGTGPQTANPVNVRT